MNKPLSVPARRDLRQRMIEDMNVRGFSAKTQHDYLCVVSRFAAFLGQSPDSATSPAMSLLRRAHAYHRDLWALEPTTCAAASIHAALLHWRAHRAICPFQIAESISVSEQTAHKAHCPTRRRRQVARGSSYQGDVTGDQERQELPPSDRKS